MNDQSFSKVINIVIIIPVLLVLLSLFLATFVVDGNITTITYKHKNDYILLPQKGAISDKGKIIGEFEAKHNNLGTILLPLETLNWQSSLREQLFIFKIKEKGSSYWISENIYRTNTFYRANIFPFGFKPIKESKGKLYYFEIIASSKGNIQPLILGKNESYIATKYQFSKQEILRNFNSVLKFILIKIYYSLSFKEVVYSFILYIFLPIFYLISIGIGLVMKKIVLAIFFFPILLYLFISSIKSDIVIFELIAIWAFLVYKYKLKPLHTFKIVLFFLILTVTLLTIGKEVIAEKSAELAYAFLFIGVTYELFLLRKKYHVVKISKRSRKQK